MSYKILSVALFVINRFLKLFNYQVNRSPSANLGSNFYPQSPSCQIANLHQLYKLAFGGKQDGQFVEVGAYDGITYSNSWGLAEAGWSGVLVEPVPSFANLCRNLYKQNANIKVVNKAAAEQAGTICLNLAGPLTTANQELYDEYSEVAWATKDLTGDSITVECDTLDSIMMAEKVKAIDVLIVDVEGSEAKVINGFALEKWTPKMIIIELGDTHPDLSSTRADDRRLSLEIQAYGYEIVYKDAINTVFIHDKVYKSQELSPACFTSPLKSPLSDSRRVHVSQ